MTTRHYIAYPMAVFTPLAAAAIVLWKVYDWSNGALGTVLLVLFGITAAVGAWIAPEELESR